LNCTYDLLVVSLRLVCAIEEAGLTYRFINFLLLILVRLRLDLPDLVDFPDLPDLADFVDLTDLCVLHDTILGLLAELALFLLLDFFFLMICLY
jgi:hypothetical protein